MTTDRNHAAAFASHEAHVHRVMIASVTRVAGSAVDELLALRPWLVKFNGARGLRSAILHAGGWFVQWHEGSAEAVEQGIARAEALTGHRHSRIVHRSVGAAVLSETLNIAALSNGDKATTMARRIYRIEREALLGHAMEPLEIWRSLIAPCRKDESSPLAPSSRRHVLAVTSGANESTDLVRSLALRYGVPVSYQRFAAGDRRAADAGAAFTDLPSPDAGTRVHSLSRGALLNTMCRLSFANMQAMVLLLGERPGAAASLADGVVDMLRATRLRPSVRLIVSCRNTSRVAQESLARLPGLEIDVLPGMGAAANASVFAQQCIGRY
ncbi:MAG: hypothetical protein V4669_10955 [Pseudomonadota bacterium]